MPIQDCKGLQRIAKTCRFRIAEDCKGLQKHVDSGLLRIAKDCKNMPIQDCSHVLVRIARIAGIAAKFCVNMHDKKFMHNSSQHA